MEKESKQNTWIRPRHRIITELVRLVLAPLSRLRYRVAVEPFPARKGQGYLILMNHTTAFDQFFIGMAFHRTVYYMATEDIFSLGFVSRALRWLVAPIPIKKQTVDISAVKTCIRIAREGGTIALAPEGNRSYSGKTEYMNPAIAKLARKIGLPIALFRIEGGYGVHPRWSNEVRRGRMRAYVARVIEPEEYAGLSDQQLMDMIRTGLFVDETQPEGPFLGKNRAQYLERVVYTCPKCGLSKWESHGHEATCTTCGTTVVYGTDKRITCKDGDFPYVSVNDWYEAQKDFVNRLDPALYTDTPAFRDRAKVSEVIVYSHKNVLRRDAALALYGDRVVIDEGTDSELVLSFDDVNAAACLGKNKLNIYHKKDVYQFKGDNRFNSLKYVNFFFRYKNIARGDENGKFLGL